MKFQLSLVLFFVFCTTSFSQNNETIKVTKGKSKASNTVNLSISPNPATDYFDINYESTIEATLELVVYNAIGRKILTKNLSSAKIRIPISSWSKGVYLIKLTNNQKVTVRRFVKA